MDNQHSQTVRSASAGLTLDEHQAADFLALSVKTLRNWRVSGEGPLFLKYGRKLVRYRLIDLERYQADHTRRSTSQTEVGDA